MTKIRSLAGLTAVQEPIKAQSDSPTRFNSIFYIAEYFAQEIIASDMFRAENKSPDLFIVSLRNGELSIDHEELVCDWLNDIAEWTEQDDLSIIINRWIEPAKPAGKPLSPIGNICLVWNEHFRNAYKTKTVSSLHPESRYKWVCSDGTQWMHAQPVEGEGTASTL